MWPIPIPEEEKIETPKSYGERNAVANKCVGKLKIDMPCLIDDMENTVDKSYDGWPDRLYIVDTNGKIAVRADRGPWGFKPGVDAATKWLAGRFPEIAGGSSEEPRTAKPDQP